MTRPKPDEPALAVVREILRLHALDEPIDIDVAAATVREWIDCEIARALAESTDVATRARHGAAATSATQPTFRLMTEPPAEGPHSPEEIRGRLLSWLSESKRRQVSVSRSESLWMVTLSEHPHGSHTYNVRGRALKPNHLDAIDAALDEVGAA